MASRFKIQQRDIPLGTSAVLVGVLINPNHYTPPLLRIFTLKIPPRSYPGRSIYLSVPGQVMAPIVTAKRGNVEINNSSQAGL